MTPVKPGSYLFRKESIAELRQRLGLSQATMAERLGVPKNTVSRWETGATTPDGESLAAIYSLGMEVGMKANFFAPVKQKAPARDTALVYWEVPQISMWNTRALEQLDIFITGEVRKRLHNAARELFKAFLSSSNSTVNTLLENLGWRVWEPESLSNHDWADDIYDQVLSDAGQNPDRSLVFLITTDTRHVDLIEELKGRKVPVYLIAPRNTGTFSLPVSSELVAAVPKKRFIEVP